MCYLCITRGLISGGKRTNSYAVVLVLIRSTHKHAALSHWWMLTAYCIQYSWAGPCTFVQRQGISGSMADDRAFATKLRDLAWYGTLTMSDMLGMIVGCTGD
jgi:hypothetical protein